MITIDQDRLVKQFMDFVQIDSPSYEEVSYSISRSTTTLLGLAR